MWSHVAGASHGKGGTCKCDIRFSPTNKHRYIHVEVAIRPVYMSGNLSFPLPITLMASARSGGRVCMVGKSARGASCAGQEGWSGGRAVEEAGFA